MSLSGTERSKWLECNQDVWRPMDACLNVLSWTSRVCCCLFVEFLFSLCASVVIAHLSGCLWFFHVWRGTAVFYVKELEGERAFVGTFVRLASNLITFHLWNPLKGAWIGQQHLVHLRPWRHPPTPLFAVPNNLKRDRNSFVTFKLESVLFKTLLMGLLSQTKEGKPILSPLRLQ